MNHLLKKARAALCALALLMAFSNCEKEELSTSPIPQQEVVSPFKIRTVSFSDIPKLTHYLESKMGRPINGLHSKDTLEGAIFDEDNVLEVIDTLNNTNYTFSFTYPDTPEHVFYNLIVGVDSLGNRKEPYILKYVADSLHIDAFLESGFDFSAFVGNINVHPIGDFFQDPSLFQRDCTQHDQYGDPIPCEEVNVNNGSTSGGSGTSGGGSPSGSVPGTGSTSTGTGGLWHYCLPHNPFWTNLCLWCW